MYVCVYVCLYICSFVCMSRVLNTVSPNLALVTGMIVGHRDDSGPLG